MAAILTFRPTRCSLLDSCRSSPRISPRRLISITCNPSSIQPRTVRSEPSLLASYRRDGLNRFKRSKSVGERWFLRRTLDPQSNACDIFTKAREATSRFHLWMWTPGSIPNAPTGMICVSSHSELEMTRSQCCRSGMRGNVFRCTFISSELQKLLPFRLNGISIFTKIKAPRNTQHNCHPSIVRRVLIQLHYRTLECMSAMFGAEVAARPGVRWPISCCCKGITKNASSQYTFHCRSQR